MKQAMILIALASLIVLGASLVFDELFRSATGDTVRVQQVSGSAEIQSADGLSTRTVTVAQELAAGERIRTGSGSEVVLSLRPEDRIVLAAESELKIEALTPERSAFQLQYGSLEASFTQYRDRTVQFDAPGNPVRIQTQEGSFTMVHDGFGTFDLRSNSGDVQLVGEDGITSLSMGERIIVSPEGILDSPVDDRARELLLQVSWPEVAEHGEMVTVTGRTDVGTSVVLEGQRIKVGSDGVFSGELALPEDRVLNVSARNALSKKSASSPPILTSKPQEAPKPPARKKTKPKDKKPQLNVSHSGEWQ